MCTFLLADKPKPNYVRQPKYEHTNKNPLTWFVITGGDPDSSREIKYIPLNCRQMCIKSCTRHLDIFFVTLWCSHKTMASRG